ncbi:hypothetical protein Tco_1476857 [Tanacetum coccineum]
MANLHTPLLKESSCAANSNDIRNQLLVLSRRKLLKIHKNARLSSDEVLKSIEIMRSMQLDDMEKASHLLLMAREIQTKGLRDAVYAFQDVQFVSNKYVVAHTQQLLALAKRAWSPWELPLSLATRTIELLVTKRLDASPSFTMDFLISHHKPNRLFTTLLGQTSCARAIAEDPSVVTRFLNSCHKSDRPPDVGA